ncbi:uncharacterized protein SPSC_02332 [Sporisorium scitamineum]|uniref:Multiple myeloma tumor-associated protein 2-like N-terminal domain-containing protein n=1 Tax=Sporisorium scitamineum TaxID=49012 RepID=A0A127ZDY9_9BASI|nr:uncharacterized protein SPSC_02332 [Sporisorium scitamineum]
MYHPTRGGARGGAAEFSWDKVKQSKDREFYLGNSVAAPTGRWQDGRDINWYNKDKNSSSNAADGRREELRKIKEAEAAALYAKLGRPPPTPTAAGGGEAGVMVGERLASGSSGVGRREGTGANSAPLDAGRAKWGRGREGEEVSEADKKLARKFARDEVRRRRAAEGEDDGRSEKDEDRRRHSSRHGESGEDDRHRRHRHHHHRHSSSRHKDDDRDDKESRRRRHYRDRRGSGSRSRSPGSSSRHRRRHHDEDRHRSRSSPSRKGDRDESRRHHSRQERDHDDEHGSRSRSYRDR